MFSAEQLPSTIPVAVLAEARRLEIREIPIWPLGSYGDPDLVLIKVAACGVCGSDFRYYAGENPWAQHTLGRWVPNPPNIVLGHEYAGTVVAVQTEGNRRLLGKRVAPLCFKVCGNCPDCLAGRTRLCEKTIHMGHGQGWGEQAYFPGAYSTYTLAWGASCFEIPAEVSFDEAAMMDILAVCVHVAEQGRIQRGRPVLCIGAGPAGNGIAQVALTTGADRVVLLDRSPTALEIARRQGSGTPIDTSQLSVEETIAVLKNLAPEGFGSIFDSVGTYETFQVALSVLGKAGTLVNMAPHNHDFPFNLMRLGGERKIVTSCNFEVGDYPIALAWLTSGKLKVKEWQKKVRFEELPGIFEDVVAGDKAKEVFKLVLDPWSAS